MRIDSRPTAAAVGSLLLLLCATRSAVAVDLSAVPAGHYAEDPNHALIAFTYTHLGFSNPMLRFADFDVELQLNKEDLSASELSATIDAASLQTGVARFDEHIKSDDFFHVSEYPTIEFVATGIESDDGNALAVTGDLTMMGQTHPVTFEGQVNGAGINPLNDTPTIGVSLKTTVQRSTWGLDKYVPAVSDAVTIMLEMEMQKQQD